MRWKAPGAVEAATTVERGRPVVVEAVCATAWGRGEEGYEAGAAEELGDEDGGMAVHLGVVDP
jgi:hypothetical protein